MKSFNHCIMLRSPVEEIKANRDNRELLERIFKMLKVRDFNQALAKLKESKNETDRYYS